jgi:hypothetical protein
MKTNLKIGFWGFVLLLLSGVLMAERASESLSHHWVTIQDEATGCQVDFPHPPLKITFDIPFQNTPPTEPLTIYSAPTRNGILVLSTFTSSAIDAEWLQEVSLKQFFETVLVPHLFYNPPVFQEYQTFCFSPQQESQNPTASFQFSYQDHGVVKKLDGKVMIKDHSLCVCFYLASTKVFDDDTLDYFLNSFRIE